MTLTDTHFLVILYNSFFKLGELLWRADRKVGFASRRSSAECLPLLLGQACVRNALRLPGDAGNQRRVPHGREMARAASRPGPAEVLLRYESVARGSAAHGHRNTRTASVRHPSRNRSWLNG